MGSENSLGAFHKKCGAQNFYRGKRNGFHVPFKMSSTLLGYYQFLCYVFILVQDVKNMVFVENNYLSMNSTLAND